MARGTALVQTTSFGLRSGHALQGLAERIGAPDIELDPDPDHELPEQGVKPMPDVDLIDLMRTFIAHALRLSAMPPVTSSAGTPRRS
ncbi:hypothetical protein A7X86_05110 [Stenotrophomonas maltophilia]|nr:hypothetical protein A7X90_04240 [Stenotrophomonas maltophilia]PZT22171.1 hypothetical protein A7X86_05110 [Stenotrophomonas maltophilia]PZT42898.1 hypothetical protein A7X99_01345 [Stenotrophomonas maltophilia]